MKTPLSLAGRAGAGGEWVAPYPARSAFPLRRCASPSARICSLPSALPAVLLKLPAAVSFMPAVCRSVLPASRSALPSTCHCSLPSALPAVSLTEPLNSLVRPTIVYLLLARGGAIATAFHPTYSAQTGPRHNKKKIVPRGRGVIGTL